MIRVIRVLLVELIVRVIVFTLFRGQHGETELPPFVLPAAMLEGQTGHKCRDWRASRVKVSASIGSLISAKGTDSTDPI
jgi:hypothetical protein